MTFAVSQVTPDYSNCFFVPDPRDIGAALVLLIPASFDS